MTGRAEVHRLEQHIDAVFERASTLRDPEYLSDYAKHLCVLVSGFLEQAIIELILEYVRQRSAPTVQRYVESRLRRFTSANRKKVIELLACLDESWRNDLENYIVDERRAAIDSVVTLRHAISHGRHAIITVTMVQMSRYYIKIKETIDHIADLCVPV